MTQEHRSGQIVPESGVYRVTHASAHAGAQLEVRLIKGRHFPACPCCQEISFELAHSDEAFLARSISAGDQISPAPSVSAEPIEQQSGDHSIPRSRPLRRVGPLAGDPWSDRGRRLWLLALKG